MGRCTVPSRTRNSSRHSRLSSGRLPDHHPSETDPAHHEVALRLRLGSSGGLVEQAEAREGAQSASQGKGKSADKSESKKKAATAHSSEKALEAPPLAALFRSAAHPRPDAAFQYNPDPLV